MCMLNVGLFSPIKSYQINQIILNQPYMPVITCNAHNKDYVDHLLNRSYQ